LIIKKIYLQPSGIVYKGMLDLMDAQNGKEIFSDYTQRTLYFNVIMFDMVWVLQFTAMSVESNRCEVTLGVKPENDALGEELRSLADSVLRREYAMLDAMLLIGTPLEVTYSEGGDEPI